MNFESYTVKNGKKYRKGYTTGSAAAGAAKAAAKILFTDEKITKINIDTPANIKLELDLEDIEIGQDYVQTAIKKDAGDDPDVTDGLHIYACVKEIDKKSIILEGGTGVGEVTKPGLPIEVGKAAINPVPRKMIKEEVGKVLPPGKGVKVIIKIPKGKKAAEKTFNPKLGIKGGISILGTTGIVEPMSESAYKESLALELRQSIAMGEEKIVLVFGNHGKRLAKKLGYKEKSVIRMSNFVAYMLAECVRLEVKEIIMIGHMGKMVKVAGGIFNTHSKMADARKEIIAAHTAYCGGSQSLIEKIFAVNTAEEAADLLLKENMNEVLSRLAKQVVDRVKDYVDNEIDVKSLIFSLENGVVSSCGLQIEEDLKADE